MNMDEEENGWRLEDDTEIRRDLDAFTKLLSTPPDSVPKNTKKRFLALKIGFAVALVAVSFVLGILYAQNVQLKQNSSKLSGEQAKLSGRLADLNTTVDRCRNALTVCSEDVDLIQGLSEYNLSPAEKYGKGYAAVQLLQNSADEIQTEQVKLQEEIEAMVEKIWRPSHISTQFWKELRQKLSNKRKLDKKLKRIEKKRLKALAELDEVFIEKKIHFQELISAKNEQRKQLAVGFESEQRVKDDARKTNGVQAPAPGIETSETGKAPKQDLASVVPSP